MTVSREQVLRVSSVARDIEVPILDMATDPHGTGPAVAIRREFTVKAGDRLALLRAVTDQKKLYYTKLHFNDFWESLKEGEQHALTPLLLSKLSREFARSTFTLIGLVELERYADTQGPVLGFRFSNKTFSV